jgi:ArsR family transcriptional regulator
MFGVSMYVNMYDRLRPMNTTSLLQVTDAQGCCPVVTDGVLDGAQAERLALVFKALGDPTRVRLLSLIAASKDGEACICNLTDPVGLSQPTVSHHMRLLVDAGLVTREQRGKWAYFAVIRETLEALSLALATSSLIGTRSR